MHNSTVPASCSFGCMISSEQHARGAVCFPLWPRVGHLEAFPVSPVSSSSPLVLPLFVIRHPGVKDMLPLRRVTACVFRTLHNSTVSLWRPWSRSVALSQPTGPSQYSVISNQQSWRRRRVAAGPLPRPSHRLGDVKTAGIVFGAGISAGLVFFLFMITLSDTNEV